LIKFWKKNSPCLFFVFTLWNLVIFLSHYFDFNISLYFKWREGDQIGILEINLSSFLDQHWSLQFFLFEIWEKKHEKFFLRIKIWKSGIFFSKNQTVRKILIFFINLPKKISQRIFLQKQFWYCLNNKNIVHLKFFLIFFLSSESWRKNFSSKFLIFFFLL